MKNDPMEIKNLAEIPTYQEKMAQLTVLMKEWIVKSGDKVNLDEPDWGVPVINSWETDQANKKKK